MIVLFFLSQTEAGQRMSSEKDDFLFLSESFPFSVHFIDVGCGDSILIRTKDDNILIDSGPYSAQGITSHYLGKLGIDKIDLFIASHTDSDHIGDFADIADKITIEKVWTSRYCIKNKKDMTEDEQIFFDTVSSKNIVLEYPDICSYKLGDIFLEVLSPMKKSKSNNENSLVIMLRWKSFSFLFTGDAGKESEKLLLGTYSDLHADVLKAGHHGSNSGTTDAFLRAVNPDCTVISAGEENNDLPSRNCTERIEKCGSQILRTDIDGTVVIISDGEKLTYLCENETK